LQRDQIADRAVAQPLDRLAHGPPAPAQLVDCQTILQSIGRADHIMVLQIAADPRQRLQDRQILAENLLLQADKLWCAECVKRGLQSQTERRVSPGRAGRPLKIPQP
jgi:hypothetical protein